MKMDGYGVIGLRAWLCALSVLLVFATSSNAFYLPGSYMRKFAQNDNLSVMVNSLTSIDTELPFGYYSLPYCKPPGGEKHSPENLGELLMGDRIENSPYQFHMNVNESSIFLCTTTKLNSDMVKMLKHRINDRYQVNIMLDSLPAIRYIKIGDVVVPWTGFLVGLSGENQYCISNHLKFTVLIHEYEDSGTVIGTGDGLDVIATGGDGNSTSAFQVVGFEVIPCSIRHSDKDALSKLHMYDKISPPIEDCKEYAQMCFQEGDQITFSYDVTFVKSDIRWPSRWDAYLKMEGARVHWFSILNSLMVITFLAGIVFVIFLRTVRRDLTKYEDLDKEAQAQMTEELSGWKLVVGDVFRAPPHAKLLSVMVGNGVQITGMALVTILFAALGFMSPAARGMLLTGMILLYLFLGIFAGYVAVRLWRTIKGDTIGWRSIAWRVACFYPGIAFGILMILNFIVWHSKSTGAIPISLFFLLIALWFCISVPLTLLGGYFGAKAEHIQIPVRVNQIPREIPKQKYPSWLMVVGAGMLPFGTLFIELFFIMSSIWLGRVYYVFGFLLVVLVLLVVVCSEVSVVLTYMHLCVEDWRWWWKSFFASGSVSLYVFLYAINYLVFDLQSLSGSASTALFLGYSILMAFSIMLATGTIGFLMSFWFVHYLFSSVKID